ncbi:MAG: SDR family oxidoreductase [Deltaproteobacteria bacterium]|nr:SDR family oxidoreductase [Deltaproteobacteria bacterium]
MKILVTGGAGFIGSHIAEACLRRGDEVIIIDNLTSGHRRNMASFIRDIQFVEGDVRDRKLLGICASGCDIVYHQAAIVSVPYSIEHPRETHDVNIVGTFNVLEAARDAKARRVVFACSAAVYGEDPELPKHEGMSALPISPYGLEKLTGEHYAKIFHALYGLETVSLRYFNVFGPRQDPKSPYSGVISIFVDRLLDGEMPTIFGDGEQCRDFVFVENVVQANLLAGSAPKAAGRSYNIGLGERTTLNQLVEMMGRLEGRPFAARYEAARPGDIRASFADISRARKELDYGPSVSVEEGLRRLLAYARSLRGA